MISQTNEQALEACIEKSLTGSSWEERSAGKKDIQYHHPPYAVSGSGYQPGVSTDFDREKFWRFLEHTQADELDKLRDRSNWQRLVLERLNRKIKKDSLLGFSNCAHLHTK